MVHRFFLEGRIQNGIGYKEYMDKFKLEVEESAASKLNPAGRKTFEFKKLNLHRSVRIEKQFVPSEELNEIINLIEEPQIWMVITENWCGDSAQNLPYLARIASINPKINFRIILRDSNTDIMDRYLTGDSRSIPKLVAFDESGNELFMWGPRPKEAHDLFYKLKEEGMPKPKIYEKIHAWYSINKGHAIESEIIEMIKKEEVTRL